MLVLVCRALSRVCQLRHCAGGLVCHIFLSRPKGKPSLLGLLPGTCLEGAEKVRQRLQARHEHGGLGLPASVLSSMHQPAAAGGCLQSEGASEQSGPLGCSDCPPATPPLWQESAALGPRLHSCCMCASLVPPPDCAKSFQQRTEDRGSA